MTALPAIRPPYTARERWQAAYRDWRRGRWMLNPGQTPAGMAIETLHMAFAPVFGRPFSGPFDRHAAMAVAEVGINFLTAAYTGTRNNFDGWVGYQFTPSQDIDVVALGRSVSGSITQDHVVNVYRVSDEVLVATVTITSSSPVAANGYAYELETVTFISGTAYRIGSAEFYGGDQWRDLGSLSSHTAVAAIDYAAYKIGTAAGYFAAPYGSADQGYVPVTFFY